MWCKKCRYCLKYLTTGSCPECGRAFDPADPSTHLIHDPLSTRRVRPLRQAAVCLDLFFWLFLPSPDALSKMGVIILAAVLGGSIATSCVCIAIRRLRGVTWDVMNIVFAILGYILLLTLVRVI
jgi:rRNA maturation protein Nop10